MGRRKAQQTNKNNTKVWNIGLYLRLSKEDKAKMAGAAFSDSIENQDKILADFINILREKYPDEVFKIVGIYIDDGLTGTNTDKRDQFLEMIHEIETGHINCVIFKDLSRLFRNHTEQSSFFEYFCPTNNVRAISINNNIDTYINPEVVYGYDLTLTGISNDRFCYTISKNIIRTFEMKRNRGDFIGAFAPFGYLKDSENRNKLIIDNEACSIVEDIFKWYSTGNYSKTLIAKKLNNLGIPSPAEYKKQKGYKYKNPHVKFNKSYWTPKTIDTILHNQMYIGNMVQGKSEKVSYKIDKFINKSEEKWVIVENTHEAIIDKDLFNKVQELLQLNTKVQTTTKNDTEPDSDKTLNIFSGMVKCADCGRAMHRKKDKKSQYARYICRTNSTVSSLECTRHSIRESELTEAVLSAIQTQAEFIDNLGEVIEKIEKSPITKIENNRLNLQAKKIETELANEESITKDLYIDMKNGLITEQQYLELKEEYQQSVAQKKAILDNIQQQKEDIKVGISSENFYFKLFKKNKNITELNRQIVIELIDQIKIHEDSMKEITVEVVFKFADQLQRIMNYIENDKNDLLVVKCCEQRIV